MKRVHVDAARLERRSTMAKKTSSGGSKKPSSGGKFKSAVTGHYVGAHYAKSHPKTTYKTSK
jgi:hypothetical protein